MARLLAHARFIIGALALMFVVALAGAGIGAAADRRSIRPQARSTNRSCSTRCRRRPSGGSSISGRVSIPDAKSGTLIQPAGRDWREFHEVTLRWIGAIAILGMLAMLVLFYLVRGMVKIEAGRSGRTVVRFNAFERFVHWMTATCFIVLALSGLNITFGKPLLLPLIGPEAFADWSQWAKYAHNYLSFPFTIGVVLILLMWIAGNIPNSVDVDWIKRGGGIVGNDHPPAYRFNAGQKMIYWIVVIGGGAVGGHRLSADVPVLRHRHRGHADCPGACTASSARCSSPPCWRTSTSARSAWRAPSRRWAPATVDVNWAKQHHALWLEEEKNRAPRARRPEPRPPNSLAE